MDTTFDGIMQPNIWNGLNIKKEKQIKSMPLNVQMIDGGLEKVVFKDVEEFRLPEEYCLTGTCSIRGKDHTFEYSAPFGDKRNTSVIGFKRIH